MPGIARPPRRHPPSYPDWGWLLAQDPASLARESSREEWVARAHAWLRARLAPGTESGPPPRTNPAGFSFPDDSFPVLAADREAGILALARVAFMPAGERDDLSRDAAGREAGGAAARLLRPGGALAPRFFWTEPEGTPRAGVPRFDGDSVALSCFVLAAAVLLGLKTGDDLCATGGWLARDGRFSPVARETLAAKLRVASAWGFRRLMVVEGQEGLDGLWPPERVVAVPAHPASALPVVAGALLAAGGAEEWRVDEILADVLMVFDRESVNSDPRDADLDATLAHTGAILEMAEEEGRDLPLTRFLARDIRARALLHAGRSAAARGESAAARRRLPEPPWPDGRLGLYLAYEIHAHNSMLALDMGSWEDDRPEHAGLDEAIRAVAAGMFTRDRMLVATYLLRTRGLRRMFRGRLEGDRALLAAAIADFEAHAEHGMRLAEYAVAALGLGNHGERRRHNYLVEALWDLRALDGATFGGYAELARRLWPAEVEDPRDGMPRRWLARGENPAPTPFDLAAWLKWRALAGLDAKPDVVAAVLEASARFDAGGRLPYPWTKVAETALQCGGGGVNRAKAQSLLERAVFFDPENRNGVFSLLAVRAAALLEWDDSSPLPRPDPDAYPDLHALRERLLGLPRPRRIAAGPY